MLLALSLHKEPQVSRLKLKEKEPKFRSQKASYIGFWALRTLASPIYLFIYLSIYLSIHTCILWNHKGSQSLSMFPCRSFKHGDMYCSRFTLRRPWGGSGVETAWSHLTVAGNQVTFEFPWRKPMATQGRGTVTSNNMATSVPSDDRTIFTESETSCRNLAINEDQRTDVTWCWILQVLLSRNFSWIARNSWRATRLVLSCSSLFLEVNGARSIWKEKKLCSSVFNAKTKPTTPF